MIGGDSEEPKKARIIRFLTHFFSVSRLHTTLSQLHFGSFRWLSQISPPSCEEEEGPVHELRTMQHTHAHTKFRISEESEMGPCDCASQLRLRTNRPCCSSRIIIFIIITNNNVRIVPCHDYGLLIMLTSGPIIWSETRQELCESLPYYRAYQTGCYVTGSLAPAPSKSELSRTDRSATILRDSIPYGYLLAAYPSQRDIWAHNGRVIISHGGGKSEVASTAGPSSPKKASLKQDQSSSDNTIRALLHSARHRLPIVLIAADSYALLPFKLKCGYAVLGWYVITDCWAEMEGFVRWKLRFEWIPAQGEPWWQLGGKGKDREWDPRQRIETFTKAQRQLSRQIRVAKDRKRKQDSGVLTPASSSSSSDTSSQGSTPAPIGDEQRHRLLFGPIKPTVKLVSTVSSTPISKAPCYLANAASCTSCRAASPLVFTLGWMCLHPSCSLFFLLPSGSPPNSCALEFSSSFLHPQGSSLNSSFPSGSPPFSLIPSRPSSRSMDQARGLWCKHCGRLSCRELIFQPICAHCGQRVGKWKPLPLYTPPKLTRNPFGFTTAGNAVFDPVISPSSGIKMTVRKEGGLAMYTFTFPATFGDCRVHLVQADLDGGAREIEADRLLEEFQKHAWPDSTQTQNNEKRAKTDDQTCEAAQSPPKLIPFRRHQLGSKTGAGRMLTQQFTCNYGVPYKHVVFMGTQPLDPTLSPPPILSTLSLLSSRTLALLPGTASFNELYPVLYLTHQKMSFHDDGEPGLGPIVSSLSLGSTCRMKFRLKEKHMHAFPQVEKRDRTVLDLPLRHGSVVVQDGEQLQKWFEHCVNPDGFRIAVTARRIDEVENAGVVRRESSSARRGTKQVVGNAGRNRNMLMAEELLRSASAVSTEEVNQAVEPIQPALLPPQETTQVSSTSIIKDAPQPKAERAFPIRQSKKQRNSRDMFIENQEAALGICKSTVGLASDSRAAAIAAGSRVPPTIGPKRKSSSESIGSSITFGTRRYRRPSISS